MKIKLQDVLDKAYVGKRIMGYGPIESVAILYNDYDHDVEAIIFNTEGGDQLWAKENDVLEVIDE